MSEDIVVNLTVQGMLLVLLLSMPAILLATIAGLGVSLLQAVTQIQEQTLGFAVKLIVVIVTLLFTAYFLASEMYKFTDYIFTIFPTLGR